MKLQSAVKKETVAVATGTGIGCLALIVLFFIFYLIFPESSVKFDYRVVLGALVGGDVAVANFFLMAVTDQNVVNVTNRDDALVSYRNRMLMRGIWIIVAIVAPCFNYAAGIIPLFIPGFVIKLRGIKMGVTGKNAASAAVPGAEGNEVVQDGNEVLQEESVQETAAQGAAAQEGSVQAAPVQTVPSEETAVQEAD